MKANMKTEFSRNNKDNIATATLVAVSLFAVASGLFNSNAVEARPAVAVQKMDTIVITASRLTNATLDTIVVTAPRAVSHA